MQVRKILLYLPLVIIKINHLWLINSTSFVYPYHFFIPYLMQVYETFYTESTVMLKNELVS